MVYQNKIKERQKVMSMREDYRKKAMDQKREELLEFNKQMKTLHEKKLNLTRQNLDFKISKQKEDFEKKKKQ